MVCQGKTNKGKAGAKAKAALKVVHPNSRKAKQMARVNSKEQKKVERIVQGENSKMPQCECLRGCEEAVDDVRV